MPESSYKKIEGGLRTKGIFKRNSLEQTLITIITVVFNGEEYLEKTILSVLNQTYDNIEYVIVDGGSTDGTLGIISKYEDSIYYWISEPDGGIGDAMNKGIFHSSGVLIQHLHAGDKLMSNYTVSQIVASYCNEDWRWCFGNQQLIDSEENFVCSFYPPKFRRWLLNSVNIIPHATVIAERSLFEEAGYFSNDYKCAMDYHLWLRFSKIIEPKQFDFFIAKFLLGGRSSNIQLALSEEIKVREELLSDSIIRRFLDITIVTIRYIKNKLNITTFVKY